MFSKILIICAVVALAQSGHLNGGYNAPHSNAYLPPNRQALPLGHGIPHAIASNLLPRPILGHNVPLHAPSPYSGQLSSPYPGPLANNGAVSHTYIRQATPLIHPANVNYATSVIHGNSLSGVSPLSLGASLPESAPLPHPTPLTPANSLAQVGPVAPNVPWTPNSQLGIAGSPLAAFGHSGPAYNPAFPNHLNQAGVLPHPLIGSPAPFPHAIPRAPINPLYEAGASPSKPLTAGLNQLNGLPYGNISPAAYPVGGNFGSHAGGYASSYPKYQFSYSVRDPLTGDHKDQQEVREGDVVKGEYSLVQPDGAIRKVSYSDNGRSGFNAVVQNSGPNHHTYSTHF